MTHKKKTIGIFGGGQLGMLLAEAAKIIGFETNKDNLLLSMKRVENS